MWISNGIGARLSFGFYGQCLKEVLAMVEWYDLNARHEATILWVAALGMFAIVRSPNIRKSTLDIAKSLLSPTIFGLTLGMFLVAVGLAASAVLLGRFIDLWAVIPVVTVSIWGTSSGMGLLMNFGEISKPGGGLRAAKRILTPATILATLTNIAIFSIWWEIAILPVIAILSIVYFYCESREEEQNLHRLAGVLLTLYSLLLVALAVKGLVDAPSAWKNLTQALLLPAWLTVGTLPYIRSIATIEKWTFLFRCPSKVVKSTDYGSKWPLNVDSAKLHCKHGAVWVEVRGRKYGVNGWAKTLLASRGFTCFDLENIWKDDPNFDGLKINIYPLIRDGQAFEKC